MTTTANRFKYVYSSQFEATTERAYANYWADCCASLLNRANNYVPHLHQRENWCPADSEHSQESLGCSHLF